MKTLRNLFVMLSFVGVILLLPGCTTISNEVSKLTGTTLEQRCVLYVDVLEPVANIVAGATNLTPEEQALVTAFNAINCPNKLQVK